MPLGLVLILQVIPIERKTSEQRLCRNLGCAAGPELARRRFARLCLISWPGSAVRRHRGKFAMRTTRARRRRHGHQTCSLAFDRRYRVHLGAEEGMHPDCAAPTRRTEKSRSNRVDQPLDQRRNRGSDESGVCICRVSSSAHCQQCHGGAVRCA
jgi:hypothetical protein